MGLTYREKKNIPQDCPIRDILSQIAAVLALLNKILDHCQDCLQGINSKNE
jgi:DNA-binding FrmR family transcriptional regulator